MAKPLLVFVHGWSVTRTATYGGLPARLKAEAAREGGPGIDVAHVHLGQYVSFRNEVRIDDVARAFEAALAPVLAEAGRGRRFACITHSTGGPVVREWLDRHYVRTGRLDDCPMSHLVMLAPANFGSALAQLGKSRLGAMKAWFGGVEPGQGVLDWLELASPESVALNLRWINDYPALDLPARARPVFPFVLSGDAIDRKLYDHVNAYTGETGSDGVVRLAAANLNASHLVLAQPALVPGESLPAARKRLRTLARVSMQRAPRTAFKIVPGVSHSGERMGIMASVGADARPHPTVDAILRCLGVRDARGYGALCDAFEQENARHQAIDRRIEVEKVPVLPDRRYVHDPHAMVLFRLLDDSGARVPEMNLLLTAGPSADPNQLPEGFLTDRQGNRRAPGNLCFYLNHAALAGCPEVREGDRLVRAERVPRPPYGLRLLPRQDEQWVEHWLAELGADTASLLDLVRPNETTVIDLRLTRVVREGVFRFTRQLAPRSFRDDPPGGPA
ncbi:MAG TPA: phospholipase [Arenimonas sp.]|uniref:esterase/lipase family protein n=1 Tax=Arenimonas sp. TaxID=1872635 RepID=UPI002D7F72BE|nr:phospholipase [Arenimonas sp.]HEU0151750.1 phospholipase [Arenimonas sp.]